MSISREWNSLKAVWIILLLAMAARIFLSSQFLLAPDEALYWEAGRYAVTGEEQLSLIQTGAVHLSTALFGNNELAVRLPSILALTLAGIYMALIAASMFSWHTALHVTLLGQGILLLNMAALVVSPYSLLLACWSAVCYHASQGMHDKRIEQWLFAGFWFGIGMLCKLTMVLLLPGIVLCFILIKPFRNCLLFPGPWFGLLLAIGIYLPVNLWLGNMQLTTLGESFDLVEMARNLVPDPAYSLQFLFDQTILLTPLVLLLILTGWLTAPTRRHLVQADAQFLILTSLPYFLLFLIFPVFEDNGNVWTATAYPTALVLIAGLNSSVRSSFKGSPNRRWILTVLTAYCITVPLVLQVVYPALPLPIHPSQTSMATTGWDLLSREVDNSARKMPDRDNTFIFTMEPKLTAELTFYLPDTYKTVSLDLRTRTSRTDYLEKELRLEGMDGIGLISTQAGIEKAERIFHTFQIERKLTLRAHGETNTDKERTYYVVRGFDFKTS